MTRDEVLKTVQFAVFNSLPNAQKVAAANNCIDNSAPIPFPATGWTVQKFGILNSTHTGTAPGNGDILLGATENGLPADSGTNATQTMFYLHPSGG